MHRRHAPLALVGLLGAAPLLSPAPAAAAPDPSSVAAPAAPTGAGRIAGSDARLATPPRADMPVPATPVPMNLPDNATAREVDGEYGIGLATLILGAVLAAAIVVGAFYLITRRSWSATH